MTFISKPVDVIEWLLSPIIRKAAPRYGVHKSSTYFSLYLSCSLKQTVVRSISYIDPLIYLFVYFVNLKDNAFR